MSLFTLLKVTSLSLILIQMATAATSAFPRGCEVTGFAYSQNYLILNETGQQSYYLMQNRSANKIELERYETGDSFMSPPLQASLSAQNWAAFASDVKSLYFKCYKHENETVALVNCQDVLDVCQYPRVKFALSNMGNYWISSDKPQQGIIEDSVAKGIYLKW